MGHLFDMEKKMPNTERIRELNDAFRKTFTGGRVLVTQSISARQDVAEIIERVRNFDAFGEACDPHHEHDFISLTMEDGEIIYAKIDYYSSDLNCGSPDPSDPAVATRVMTIMLAENY